MSESKIKKDKVIKIGFGLALSGLALLPFLALNKGGASHENIADFLSKYCPNLDWRAINSTVDRLEATKTRLFKLPSDTEELQQLGSLIEELLPDDLGGQKRPGRTVANILKIILH